jgi:hypothetical protein
MSPDGLLLIGALTAGSVAALAAWSRHLPKKPQLVLAGLAGAALIVAVLDVHFFGPERGDIREWVALAATVLAVVGGGPAVVAVFTLVDRTAPASARLPEFGEASGGKAAPAATGEGLRGGAWIGALERLAVVGTLVAGWPEGMAVVLAIKALGRYPELRTGSHEGAAEGFIIGTLVSILWAAACAFVIAGGMGAGGRMVRP